MNGITAYYNRLSGLGRAIQREHLIAASRASCVHLEGEYEQLARDYVQNNPRSFLKILKKPYFATLADMGEGSARLERSIEIETTGKRPRYEIKASRLPPTAQKEIFDRLAPQGSMMRTSYIYNVTESLDDPEVLQALLLRRKVMVKAHDADALHYTYLGIVPEAEQLDPLTKSALLLQEGDAALEFWKAANALKDYSGYVTKNHRGGDGIGKKRDNNRFKIHVGGAVPNFA